MKASLGAIYMFQKKLLIMPLLVFIVGLSSQGFSTEAEFSPSAPVFPTEAADESVLSPETSVRKGRESVISLCFESGHLWGSFFDGAQNLKTYRDYSGINLFTYFIGNGNIVGFFAHGLLLGALNRGTVNGVQPEYTNHFGLQTSLLFGPLFRHRLSEKFALFYGAGLSFLLIREACAQYIPLTDTEVSFSKLELNVGVGINIMLRYAHGDSLVFLAGCIFTYDFLSFVELESVSSNPALNTSGRAKDFSMLGVRPYIAVGWRI